MATNRRALERADIIKARRRELFFVFDQFKQSVNNVRGKKNVTYMIGLYYNRMARKTYEQVGKNLIM